MKFDSPQAVFDHVVTSLIKQGQPSMAVRGGDLVCVYRGNDGRKCAGGWCIDDEEYSERMEGDRIRCLIGTLSVPPKSGVEGRLAHLLPYSDLLDGLQRAHDDPAREKDLAFGPWLEAFIAEARKVADRHGLRTRSIDNAMREQW